MPEHTLDPDFQINTNYLDYRVFAHEAIEFTCMLLFFYLFAVQGLAAKKWYPLTNIWMIYLCVQMTKCTFFQFQSILYPLIRDSPVISTLATSYMGLITLAGLASLNFGFYYLYYFIGHQKRYDLYSRIVYVVIPAQLFITVLIECLLNAFVSYGAAVVFGLLYTIAAYSVEFYGYTKIFEPRKQEMNRALVSNSLALTSRASLLAYKVGFIAKAVLVFSVIFHISLYQINAAFAEPSTGVRIYAATFAVYVTAMTYPFIGMGMWDIAQMDIFQNMGQRNRDEYQHQATQLAIARAGDSSGTSTATTDA